METKVKRREWVKTAAIVFLSVLLVLTFFSNTIMNRSLPEVAAQYVESGSINARIRGTGTVAANEVYEVSLSQTRKVRSVLVKVGQEVTAGDPLLQLESMESEELKAAQDQLDQMELNYQKSLINASNDTATEDHSIQKLREEYEDALRVYRQFSNMSPDDIEIAKIDAQKDLDVMNQELSFINSDLEQANASLLKLSAQVDNYSAKIDTINDEIDAHVMRLDGIEASLGVLERDMSIYQSDYDALESYVISKGVIDVSTQMQIYADDQNTLAADLIYTGHATSFNASQLAGSYSMAYDVLTTDAETLASFLDNAPILTGVTDYDQIYSALSSAARSQVNTTKQNLRLAEAEKQKVSEAVAAVEAQQLIIDELTNHQIRIKDAIAVQTSVVSNYEKAAGAASALKSAEDQLESAVFTASLGDPNNLDIQAANEAIEVQKKLIEELTLEADGQEITSNVSGVISAINVTAGATAAAEQPVISITIADRGYTINVPVTNEQARQVRIGDTAQITNYYWGDIAATLENIANDPSSGGKGKMLIFRITGEGVEPGTNLTLSIGQKSANYDCLVPNSAIRSDANGSFVLVVTAKSSPLGNRYQATRADVTVLASDDTTSAVTGLAYGDFVITTSTQPLEAGDLVRLPDNG